MAERSPVAARTRARRRSPTASKSSPVLRGDERLRSRWVIARSGSTSASAYPSRMNADSTLLNTPLSGRDESKRMRDLVSRCPRGPRSGADVGRECSPVRVEQAATRSAGVPSLYKGARDVRTVPNLGPARVAHQSAGRRCYSAPSCATGVRVRLAAAPSVLGRVPPRPKHVFDARPV